MTDACHRRSACERRYEIGGAQRAQIAPIREDVRARESRVKASGTGSSRAPPVSWMETSDTVHRPRSAARSDLPRGVERRPYVSYVSYVSCSFANCGSMCTSMHSGQMPWLNRVLVWREM